MEKMYIVKKKKQVLFGDNIIKVIKETPPTSALPWLLKILFPQKCLPAFSKRVGGALFG